MSLGVDPALHQLHGRLCEFTHPSFAPNATLTKKSFIYNSTPAKRLELACLTLEVEKSVSKKYKCTKLETMKSGDTLMSLDSTRTRETRQRQLFDLEVKLPVAMLTSHI